MKRQTAFEKWIKRYAGSWYDGWLEFDKKLAKAAFKAGFNAGRRSVKKAPR